MMETLFGNGAAWFTVPALFGTCVFLFQITTMLLGGDAEVMGDVELDIGELSDSTHAFQILSLQSIAAFMMGFGWAAFAASEGFGWSNLSSIVIGVVFGAFLVWMLALILKGIHDLQSSGNVRIASAVGLEGDVYVTVPEAGAGRGQVRLIIKGRQRIFNAVAEADPLPTGSRVRVTRANDDNTLTVNHA